MKRILLATLICFLGSPAFAENTTDHPIVTWSDGNSCTEANQKEVSNIVSEKSEAAKDLLGQLNSVVQAWAESQENIEGVFIQSGVNFTAVPTLHLLEGAADGVTVISKNAHRFIGYSFDAVTCIADNLVPGDNSKALSPEMRDALSESKSAVNCVVEFSGTVTSLFFLSSAELVQKAAGTVNNMISDVFTGLNIALEDTAERFLDKEGRFNELVGEGIYIVATWVNKVEVIITGTLTAVVVLVNTGAEVASQLACGTARALKGFIRELKRGRPLKAIAVLAKGIMKSVHNGAKVTVKGLRRILAIFRNMFKRIGIKMDEVSDNELKSIIMHER